MAFCKCGCEAILPFGKYKGRERQYLHGHNQRGKSATELQLQAAIENGKKTKGRAAWNRGISLSDEQKLKLSASLKGRSVWNKGLKTGPQDPELVERRVAPARGKKRSEEFKSRMSRLLTGNKNCLGNKISQERAEQFRRNVLLHQELDLPECKCGFHTKPKSPSKFEISVGVFLDSLDIKNEPGKKIGRYHVDFYLPDFQQVIEADGDYWHNRPGAKERDAERDEYLADNFGLSVIRVKESVWLKK